MINRIKMAMGTLLLCAALGPYLTTGLRLDHIVILSLAAVSVLFAISMRTIMPTRLIILTLTLIAGAIITMACDYIVDPFYREASYISGIGRLSLPALILSISAFVLIARGALDEAHAKYFLSVIVWVAALSGFITTLSLIFDLSWIENMYSIGGEAGVWAQAKGIGRYTGLFNQPLEAGVFYSTALFVAIFITYSNVKVSWNTTIVILFIVLGGTLSLSKNFVVVGVALSLYFLYSLNKRIFYRLILSILLAVVIIGFGVYTYAEDSFSFIDSFFEIYKQDGLLSAMTAGRFGGYGGTESEVEQLFKLFLIKAPLTGFGVNTHLPLDNGYLEYGYQGGFFALLSNLLFFAALLIFSIKASGDYSKLLFVLAIYGIIASLGGPVITANRANISYLFCICICLCYSQVNFMRMRPPD